MTKFKFIIYLLFIVIILLLIIVFSKSVQNDLFLGKIVSSIKQTAHNSNRINTGERIYYIDQSYGSNTYDGRSPDKAWKNFSPIKHNKFRPGDTIVLKRGNTWNHTLFPPNGGTVLQPIRIDAYGMGESPIIDVVFKHPTAIQVSHSHISIKNLTLKNSAKSGIDISVNGGFKNLRIHSINIYNAGRNGIGVYKGGKDLIITNCFIKNSKNNGIHLGGSKENKLTNVVISKCRISGVLNNDGITIHEDGDGNSAGHNFLLKNNFAELCGEQGFDITTGKRVLLLSNTSQNNMQGGVLVGHSASEITINNHLSVDEPAEKTSAAINLAGTLGNIRVINSIIRGNGYHLLRMQTSNIAIINNNFIWNGGRSSIDVSGKIKNIYFMNNIVCSKQNKMGKIRFLENTMPPNHSSYHFDHNLYYVPKDEVIFLHNNQKFPFKDYQQRFNVEGNSQHIIPGFVDMMNDNYQLKHYSGAIDNGKHYGNVEIYDKDTNEFNVSNALLFYENKLSDELQCMKIAGEETDSPFNIVKVDYINNKITVNKRVSIPGAGGKIIPCYAKSRMDIGKYEFSK